MYHLFVGYLGSADTGSEIAVSPDRFLEYTDTETQIRYKKLTRNLIRELKQYPALLMQEGCEDGAFIASIQDITRSGGNYLVKLARNEPDETLSREIIQRYATELDIHNFEFNRTHWAMKAVDLLSIVGNLAGSVVPSKYQTVFHGEDPENKPAATGKHFNTDQVFIVHGHDEHAKNDVKDYVESRGLEPIILHLQASGGRTIIEKIDHYSNVGFGIVLYTECDVGAKRNTLKYSWRARQNVVFEHGYLIAKLDRSRVAALVKGSVETPNDISGVVYVAMDASGSWKDELDGELRDAGYDIENL